eukprot:2425362-Alexandrium_andersonii.AAC.1
MPHASDAKVFLGSTNFPLGGGSRAPEAHLALDHQPLAWQAHRGHGALLGLAGEARELLATAGDDEAREREA